LKYEKKEGKECLSPKAKKAILEPHMYGEQKRVDAVEESTSEEGGGEGSRMEVDGKDGSPTYPNALLEREGKDYVRVT